ncbi:MAG: ABC transporter ATP-binding protein, partial [Chloroflexota bacterium]
MSRINQVKEATNLLRWVLGLCWQISNGLFIAFVFIIIISSVLPAGAALAVRGLVNEVSDGLVSGDPDVGQIYFWLIVGFGTALALILGEAAQRLVAQQYRTALNYRMQLDILEHSSQLDYAYFEDPEFKDALARARQMPAQHLANLLETLFGFVYKFLQIGSLLVILMAIEPIIVLLLIPIGLPYLWFQWWFSRYKFEETDSRIPKRRWLNYYTQLLSHENNVAEIKLYNLGPVFIQRSQLLLAEFRALEKRIQWITFGGLAIFALLSISAVYYSLSRATFAVVSGALTIGDIAIYGAAATRLRGQLEGLVALVSSYRWEIFFARNLRRLFDVEPQLIPDGHINLTECEGTVEFKNVSFAYPRTEKLILDDVSFTIRPGETIAIV